MNRPLAPLAIVLGFVVVTLLGWWAFGQRETDSGGLVEVDVASVSGGLGKSREVVRRVGPAETNRSESEDAATAAVDLGRNESMIRGVVTANGRPLPSAIVWCEAWSESLSDDSPGVTTTILADSIDSGRPGIGPMDAADLSSSENQDNRADRDFAANLPAYGGIRDNRRTVTSEGGFSFDRLTPATYVVRAEVLSGAVRYLGHAVVAASAAKPAKVVIDLDLCRVEIVAIGNGVLLYAPVWRILDEDGRIVGRRGEALSAETVDRPPVTRAAYVRSGRAYRAEVCADGHHPLEVGFAIAAGQQGANIEAALRRVDSNGELHVHFEGPPEFRPSLVRFRIDSTQGSGSGADVSPWTDDMSAVVSRTLSLDEDGTAVLAGLALRTKRHLLTIEIPDFPLTDCLAPDAVPFDFTEGKTIDLRVRLERGGHLKMIVHFPIDPADSAKISIESTGGRDVSESVDFIGSFDTFGGRRLGELSLRQPTGDLGTPVDRPFRSLRPLRPGRYVLVVAAPGLDTERVAFEIAAGATSEIDVTMRLE